MESRLSQVLRAGEARRQTARTGALEMADLNDDALRLITDAIGNGDADAACRAAKNWCALNRRHRAMCQEGGDELWDALTTRVFGANQIGVHREDSQANFFELCRIAVDREGARRWLRARHPGWTMTGGLQDNAFLDRLGAILAVVDNNYVGQPMQNIALVEMLRDLFVHKPRGFPNTDLLALYSLDSLYALVRSNVDAEIDSALNLLSLLANDFEHDLFDNFYDSRQGYVAEAVPRLTQLLVQASDSQNVRKATILNIWKGLLAETHDVDDEETLDKQGRYARALLRHSVDSVLWQLAVNSPNSTLRRKSASVLRYISHALNASLTMAMHDASELGRRRMGLVYGRD